MNKLMQKTRRISWMLSGWWQISTDSSLTQCVSIGCPDDFFAVRVGFPNISAAPYIISKTIACPSTTWNDYFNPIGGAKWTAITFANAGADVNQIVTSAEAPSSILVAGNSVDMSTGQTCIPKFTWSDWVPISSLPRTDVVNGVRVLMLRALMPGDQAFTLANGGFIGWSGNPYSPGHKKAASLNQGFDYAVGTYPPDRVTDTTIPINASAVTLMGSPIAIVQFLTKTQGVVGMTTGDSHHMGTSTTSQFSNYLFRALSAIGSKCVGTMPVGCVNAAVAGSSSNQFIAYLTQLLGPISPSFVVLPGWTYNDIGDVAHADSVAMNTFFARLLSAAEAVVANGALPIYLTPFPRDSASMSPTQLRPWLSLRESILAMQTTGALVCDATSILGNRRDSGFDGTYLPGYTADGIHPNDDGHAAISSALRPLIRAACRL